MTKTRDNSITLVGLSKKFDERAALDDISLSIGGGSFVSIVGPSGCGKTTLLRIISGLERADSGKVYIGGSDVTDLKAGERNVLTVFQKYALLPHLSVLDNVALGLKISRMAGKKTKAEIAERAKAAIASVGLLGKEKRSVTTLSGGEQQRVALARAMVLEPDVLLLDEPLGAVDGVLKRELQKVLTELHKKSGATFLYVTHDFTEAMTMSGTVFVMNKGRIVESGTPHEIYEKPKKVFTANFVGVKSVISCIVGSQSVSLCGKTVKADTEGFNEGEAAFAVIDNNGVRILEPNCALPEHSTILNNCTVLWCEYTGGRYKSGLGLMGQDSRDGEIITSYAEQSYEVGQNVSIELPEKAVAIIGRSNENNGAEEK